MRLLYPDNPFNQREPDEVFAQEYDAARARGFDVSLFSFEDFERGHFNPKPKFAKDEAIIYRGWMLGLDGYARLTQAVAALSARMVVSPDSYRAAHHLPSWYPLIQPFTAETLILEENADFVAALRDKNWDGYFVKDYVKSLNTGAGSLAKTPAEIEHIVAQIKKYRGEVEGGVCVRRGEAYKPDSERRYFVAHARAFSADGDIPAAVAACAPLIPSPFFSVDVALRADGILRIIEIGDGQVSDRKEWSAEKLVAVLEQIAV